MTNIYNRSIFWFRRDLRLFDNAALYKALKYSKEVLPIFIYDRNILDEIKNREDARVEFIYKTISELKKELQILGSDLKVYYGKPNEIWTEIISKMTIDAVFINRDYEPYSKLRDKEITELLLKYNIPIKTYKDHVIFEKHEILKDNNEPYVVFTPYKKKWLSRLNSRGTNHDSYFFKSYPSAIYKDKLAKVSPEGFISLAQMNFFNTGLKMPSKKLPQRIISEYNLNRDFPGKDGTTKLGIHFRFGTISIREKARKSIRLNEVFLSELIWRDFYSGILDNFPKVVDAAFREKYDCIVWRNNESEFKKWCEGKTGYPMVDAGMRELNATGFMHNRVRMVVASFLTKHLLIDWRWGEAYFAEKLLDFDLASNNGGWQWAAGCGTDAAPYFRIFNPTSQMEKFDKERTYIKKWVPEFLSEQYIQPIVEHKMARERCLRRYKEAIN